MSPRVPVVPVAALAALLLAGCFQAAPAHLTDWREEAEAHGAMGLEASFGLDADGYTIVGPGSLRSVETPFTLHATDTARAGPLLFFHGTVLGAGTGLIVLKGTTIAVTNGTIPQLPVERITSDGGTLTAHPHDHAHKDRPDVTVPPGRDDIDTAWFFAVHTPITARDLVVETAELGILISDGNETPLEFPITFDADHLAIDADGHIEVEEVVFDAEHFAYGGDTTGGAVRPVGAQPITAPPGVFGDDARIRLGADRLESLDTFRLTQVLDGDGYGIASQVELRPHRDLVEVDAGNTSWVRVDYREHGYGGTAVLENVTVAGPAAAFLRVPLDRPPWLIEQLFETTRSAGWAAPFVALPIVFASPALILGEALLRGFDCLLNDCPGEHPYPPWMAPGETGRFYYQVDASAATPGQYPGTITFTGANHPPVTIEMTVQVT